MRKRRSILKREEGPAHGSCERRAYRLEREKRSFFRMNWAATLARRSPTLRVYDPRNDRDGSTADGG